MKKARGSWSRPRKTDLKEPTPACSSKQAFYLIRNMHLEILTTERKVYTGEVYGLHLPGIDGSFEVLDKHAPLIAALAEGRLKVLNDKHNFSFYTIKGGFIEMLNNHAVVLVEGAIPEG